MPRNLSLPGSNNPTTDEGSTPKINEDTAKQNT
jgi:hypothetical protein